MPAAQPPNPPGKERSLHLTISAQTTSIARFPTLCSSYSSEEASSLPAHSTPLLPHTRLFGHPYLHMSPKSGEESPFDRRAFSSSHHVQTERCKARIRPTHCGPSAISSEGRKLSSRSILLWDIPMRGGCAQTHAAPRIQIGPNTFPERSFPHLWHHACALSTTGH